MIGSQCGPPTLLDVLVTVNVVVFLLPEVGLTEKLAVGVTHGAGVGVGVAVADGDGVGPPGLPDGDGVGEGVVLGAGVGVATIGTAPIVGVIRMVAVAVASIVTV